MSAATTALVSGHTFLQGLPEGTTELVAELGEHRAFPGGALLFREGEAADTMYLITSGRVAIEVHSPSRGPIVIETIGPGDVAGLSWSSPPFRYQFDVRAVDDVEAVAVPGGPLREALSGDPVIGQAFVSRLNAVILERLQAARVRLLDLYGHPDGR